MRPLNLSSFLGWGFVSVELNCRARHDDSRFVWA